MNEAERRHVRPVTTTADRAKPQALSQLSRYFWMPQGTSRSSDRNAIGRPLGGLAFRVASCGRTPATRGAVGGTPIKHWLKSIGGFDVLHVNRSGCHVSIKYDNDAVLVIRKAGYLSGLSRQPRASFCAKRAHFEALAESKHVFCRILDLLWFHVCCV